MILNYCLVALLLSSSVIFGSTEDVKPSRTGRLLSLFNVIRFKNDPCETNNGESGICRTKQECSDQGGEASGECASKYGVCCKVTKGCGSRMNENCTYFEETNPAAGVCKAEFCPENNICQLRLDFPRFVLSGPSSTAVPTLTLNGGVVAAKNEISANPASMASQCLTDTFSVSGQRQGSPVICGTNSGEHMFIDANPGSCNSLTFSLGSIAAVGSVLAPGRGWSIKISTFSCDFSNLAPRGCTQYFYGSDNQIVKTFNYDGGQHLANQDQNICVRRERGVCRLCWTTINAIDFMVSGEEAATTFTGLAGASSCCNYMGVINKAGYDCVVIPGRVQTGGKSDIPTNQFCGRALSAEMPAAATTGVTSVCQLGSSFNIRFKSDPYEFTMANLEPGEANTPDKGFKLTYIQEAGNC